MNQLQVSLREAYLMINNPTQTEDIQNNMKIIEQLEKEPNFIKDHVGLLTNAQIANNIKLLMLIYLTKNIQRIIETSQNQIIQESLNLYLNQFYVQLDFTIKRQIISFIRSILNHQKMAIYKQTFRKTFIREITSFSTKDLKPEQYSYIICFGQALILPNSLIQNSELVKKIMPNLIIIANKLLIQVQDITSQQNQQQILQLMKQMLILIKSCLKQIKAKHIELMKILFMDDLKMLIEKAMLFKYQENVLHLSLFNHVQSSFAITKNINIIKQKSINIINYIFNILVTNIKNQNLIETNPIYKDLSQTIEECILQLTKLFSIIPCYNLTSELYLLDVAYQIFNLLSNVIQNSYFYSIFSKHKSALILNIIFPIIHYNIRDIQAFKNDEFQYIEHIMQVINPDNQQQMNDNESIEDYESFRTYSAKLLRLLCKFQDGSFNQILQVIMNAYSNNSFEQISKSLLLFIICIIFPQINCRKVQCLKIFDIVKMQFQNSIIPLTDEPTQQCIQYTFIQILLYKYIGLIVKDDSLLDKVINRAIQMIYNQQTWNVHLYFIIFVLDSITLSQDNHLLSGKIISIYNWAIDNSPWLAHFLLDSYLRFIKRDQFTKQHNLNYIIEGLDKLIKKLKTQLQEKDPNLIIINKIINIFSQIIMNQKISLNQLSTLEQYLVEIMQQLRNQLEMNNYKKISEIIQFSFVIYEYCVLLFRCFIERQKNISDNHIYMFCIIELLFEGPYEHTFGDSFKIIESILKYTNENVIQHQQLISKIATMCLQTLAKAQNITLSIQMEISKSTILLQSIIYRYSFIIKAQFYVAVDQSILHRLNTYNPCNKYLYSNLVALLSNSFGFTINCYPQQQQSFMLEILHENQQCFENCSYTTKVLLYGMIKIMQNIQITFIKDNLQLILNKIINLIQSLNKEQSFHTKNKTKALQYEQYKKIVSQIKNGISQLDFVSLFRQKYELYNSANPQILQRTLCRLKQNKKDRLCYILKTQRIKNQYRIIYKIKKN